MSKWLITMVSFRPLNGVIPHINGLSMAYKWRLLLTNWDDPPSMTVYSIKTSLPSCPSWPVALIVLKPR